MSGQLILVRHGPSAHRARGWHTSATAREWLAGYDRAGIASHEAPPAALIAMARDADQILASDLPRAVESARVLASGRPVNTSALLREAAMTVPELGPVRLPLTIWALLMAAHWITGRRRGFIPSSALQAQAQAAANHLDAEAKNERTILVVTHATIRTLIAEELVRAGWRREAGGSRYAHWGTWVFRMAAA